jgi:hypothetical protein
MRAACGRGPGFARACGAQRVRDRIRAASDRDEKQQSEEQPVHANQRRAQGGPAGDGSPEYTAGQRGFFESAGHESPW